MFTQTRFQPACFYHVYPLGLCGAPERNQRWEEAQPRIRQLEAWIPYWQELGIEALYLGPVFESQSHGYDTVDYFQLDRRLGQNSDLRSLVNQLHAAGIQVLLDGVFHHVGREFFAFADIQQRGADSPYRDWFFLDFSRRSPLGDAFNYACWEGHAELVKLNLNHPPVRDYFFTALETWIREFEIDGLRLDVAYALEKDFLKALARKGKSLKPGFWLLGEVIHGGYQDYLVDDLLDSVTNYEGYKALFSSHNDRNYFELSHSLERIFGAGGLCREKPLYNFADNHDVDRVASQLKEPAHLYPLAILLMSMPGIPALYAGSEWGLGGRKQKGDDRPLRPALASEQAFLQAGLAPLWRHYQRLIALRRHFPQLFQGVYQPLCVRSEQLVFSLQGGETGLFAVNMSAQSASVPVTGLEPGLYEDLLNPGVSLELHSAQTSLELDPHWGRILRRIR
ncbi:alpha-amylase [bacterium (Candidatus Blackallbacteria) CG17_big_fil_post_rev_8_21_14_2_50_48_46]|uniref:Alpha-amylase n=1 Tax=bacterium (Candidatus Blackallbacteria) CG17_big_fil_post_rev_8_21_14_2_50_48_46 TaxID=2014261 RepID=A0A2M7G443_9BACT|nr:MAG: alpha-amylase [bacterium (Candidatus Blackallbacteria) CG18_big_fil_WC_8_21_14_2_50_49_26]PIW16640.1 MAG: alpha-amylase [bacterium (Candidatus Blackallbacteria) CG17_big_fil_post_rev_8_21_14_2_50_48_46]PIW46147.1 MAG: alpha-amylase [bacterium (Candidatus Blackallbacteria) CG13_big_fil_rev_8_21_14_2_50_49_14]